MHPIWLISAFAARFVCAEGHRENPAPNGRSEPTDVRRGRPDQPSRLLLLHCMGEPTSAAPDCEHWRECLPRPGGRYSVRAAPTLCVRRLAENWLGAKAQSQLYSKPSNRMYAAQDRTTKATRLRAL
jgi:hypothetical protein